MARNSKPHKPLSFMAWLGHEPSREALGTEAPPLIGIGSMRFGGDARWRAAMLWIGHEPLAVAACSVASMAFEAWSKSTGSSPAFEARAREAVESLTAWKQAPKSPETLEQVQQYAIGFAVESSIGGPLYESTGFEGKALARIVGKCSSVVLDPENARHVRWFGEAAEELCKHFHVPESQLRHVLVESFGPYLIPQDRDTTN